MTENKMPGDVLDYAGLKSENEQLKQRLDAVVAECAVVKSLNSKLCDELSGYETDNEDFGPAPQSLALAYSTETHAADAALAEVEAKAIEKFIAKKLKQLEAMHPDTHAFGATAMEIRSQINELQAYVVELREAR